jgi:hypothetical protein
LTIVVVLLAGATRIVKNCKCEREREREREIKHDDEPRLVQFESDWNVDCLLLLHPGDHSGRQ